MTSRVVLVAIALAPWLTLLPIEGPFAVLTQALVVIAAFHGAGIVTAQVSGRTFHPILAIWVGLAALVGLGGLAIALGQLTLATQVILIYGFAGVHTAVIGLRFATYRRAFAKLRTTRRSWLVPGAVLVAIGCLQVVGAAGDVGARPFDDDGHVLAQLARLRDTGTLGDAIGYPRSSQLGGQLALDALVTAAGDVHAIRLTEAIAFVLVLALVFARARPHDTTTGLWALLVVLGATAFAFVPDDPATAWTAVGLVLALHAMLEEDLPPLPLGIVAGALVTLRFELAPIAGVAIVAAWWPQRGNHEIDHRRALRLVLGMLAVVVPFAVARIAAWSAVPPDVHALLVPARGSLAIKLGIAAAIAGATTGLVLVVISDRALRWLVIASGLAVAGVMSQLTGDRPYAIRFLWPIGIACVLVIAVELVRGRKLAVPQLLLALGIALVVTEAQVATGRMRWTRRALDLVAHVEYTRHVADAPISGGYAGLLRQVPAGARVAIWIARPERLAYGDHEIIDLRTPRTARLRVHRFGAHPSRLAQLVAATGARYLLLEADDRHLARMADADYRRACAKRSAACDDDLEALAARGRVLAIAPGLRLVELAGK
ncbi:MAG: hypothetical protein WKG01_10220 [Kofleriaceae bacterium]